MKSSPEVTETVFDNLRFALHSRGSLEFRISGKSMLPLIKPGAMIQLEPLRGSPEKFDILVVRSERALLGHYVWHLNELSAVEGERTILTRGLNRNLDDLPVPLTSVLGRVTNYRIGFFRRLYLNLRAAWKARELQAWPSRSGRRS
ncbi:MAG: S24/S26 family peptidase [Bdellovibrionia bacterium]